MTLRQLAPSLAPVLTPLLLAACGGAARTSPDPASSDHASRDHARVRPERAEASTPPSADAGEELAELGWSQEAPLPACGIEAAPAQLRATLVCPDGARPFAESSDEVIQGALVRVTQAGDGAAAAAEYRARCEATDRRAFVDLTACEDAEPPAPREPEYEEVEPEAVEAT